MMRQAAGKPHDMMTRHNEVAHGTATLPQPLSSASVHHFTRVFSQECGGFNALVIAPKTSRVL
jgi:hypothetical protein